MDHQARVIQPGRGCVRDGMYGMAIKHHDRPRDRRSAGLGVPGAMVLSGAIAPSPIEPSTSRSLSQVNGNGATAPDRADLARSIEAIAQSNDRQAFAMLFGHFAPRVKSYLLRLGASSALAEDLAQETMLAVWRKAAYFDASRAEAATWIFTIARNLRIDALRRERHPEPCPEEAALFADSPLPADEMIAVTRREDRLREALKSLPEEQAEIVRLSYFQDKPHREIERALGIPLGTVKSRLRLALTRLRTSLGEAS